MIPKAQRDAWRKASQSNKNFHWSSRVISLLDELERQYSQGPAKAADGLSLRSVRPMTDPAKRIMELKNSNENTGCSRVECITSGPYYVPVLLLRATSDGEDARMAIPIRLCAEHRDETTIADLNVSKNWDLISKKFTDCGQEAPQRNLTRLSFAFEEST